MFALLCSSGISSIFAFSRAAASALRFSAAFSSSCAWRSSRSRHLLMSVARSGSSVHVAASAFDTASSPWSADIWLIHGMIFAEGHDPVSR